MNSQTEGTECKRCDCGARCAYVVAILGAFLIVYILVRITYSYTRPEPIGEDRAAMRSKALAELRAANEEVLHNPSYVWQDPAKGIVRMPIDRAKELALKLWQHPDSARSNLIARVEKATAVAPPPSYE
ncbi:MAG TPA: hypothetical protein VFB72_11950 [Verrucomicrobiae bacterium]|nr:hypothetical protein [Verrucomicrobiae bacterium]